MFPEKDDNEEPDSLEVNTLVCMEEEDDVADHEEDVNPDSELNYVTVCSIGFPTMSSYSSSASNSCLELCPNLCCCTDTIGSIACIDSHSLVICSICCCLNYEENIHCINCLGLIKVNNSQTYDVGLGFVSNKIQTKANQVCENINTGQLWSFTSEISVNKKDPYGKFKIPRRDPIFDPAWCCEEFDVIELGAHLLKLSVDMVTKNTAEIWSEMAGRDVRIKEKLVGVYRTQAEMLALRRQYEVTGKNLLSEG